MTVGGAGKREGRLLNVATESRKEVNEAEGRPVTFEAQEGKIFANLQIGADVAGTKPLLANDMLSHQGIILVGQGFRLEFTEARGILSEKPELERYLPRYQNGKQFVDGRIIWRVIDFYGLDEDEARAAAPSLFQILKDRVWPERSQNRDKQFRESWWLFGRQRPELRQGIGSLERYIATCRTARHRIFGFVESDVLPDAKLIAIALNDSALLAVLSSSIHVRWAAASGAWLGVGNDSNYNHADCFDPFPFPDLTPSHKTRLRALGEELDAHRKARQAAHPKLTLTQMYNVLEKLRAGEDLSAKDREIYDQGLVGILKDIHDRIDQAVAEAYGWPADLSDEDILQRLVDLNKQRAAEEATGHIRWLRPDYQNPEGRQAAKGKTTEMDLGPTAKVEKTPWPKTLPAQIAAVREALGELGEATPDEVARRFVRARTATVQPLLESLAALGQAETEAGLYWL